MTTHPSTGDSNRDKTRQIPSHWRDDIKHWLTRTASSLDELIDARWQYLKKRFGWDGVPKIQPYIGYANQERVWLHGRVLTNPPADLPAEDDNWWENLANTYQRFASDEVPGCDVEIRLGDAVYRATTDAEGYFFVEEQHAFSAPLNDMWGTASMQIVNHSHVVPEASTTTGRVLAPTAGASYGIISDVDDTILYTGATRLLTMAKLTFLGNARTRLPLPGVAALYRAMQGSDANANPIFYISSSPWNLFDLLEDFLDLNGIPMGPLLLRDLGFDDNKLLKEGHGHKLEKTRNIMTAYPDLPFVLFGDSGQEDAKLYARAAEEFRDQIRAIFIRDVDPNQSTDRDRSVIECVEKASSVGVPMHLVRDSAEAAEWAVRLNLLDKSLATAIRHATEQDRQRNVFE